MRHKAVEFASASEAKLLFLNTIRILHSSAKLAVAIIAFNVFGKLL